MIIFMNLIKIHSTRNHSNKIFCRIMSYQSNLWSYLSIWSIRVIYDSLCLWFGCYSILVYDGISPPPHALSLPHQHSLYVRIPLLFFSLPLPLPFFHPPPSILSTPPSPCILLSSTCIFDPVKQYSKHIFKYSGTTI